MITRRHGFPRLFHVSPAYHDNLAGMIKTETMNGVPVSYPIARPGGVYQPHRAPYYLHGHEQNNGHQNRLVARNSPSLNLPPVQKAMDPSDPHTWQRQYIF